MEHTQQVERMAKKLFVMTTREVSNIAKEIASRTKKKVGSGQGSYFEYCEKIGAMLLTKKFGPELIEKYKLDTIHIQ